MRTIFFTILLSFLFIPVSAQLPDLIPYRKGKLWGYCNADKQIIIPCAYNYYAGFFNDNGVAIVVQCEENIKQKEYYSGLIHKSGKILLPCQYERISQYDSNSNNNNNVFFVTENLKKGVIDSSGEWLVPCQYEAITILKLNSGESFYKVKLNGKHGVFDDSGKEIIPCSYTDIVNSSSHFWNYQINYNVFLAQNKDSCSLYDRHGKKIISATAINNFEKNLYKIQQGDKVGLLDTAGKEILPCLYEDIGYILNQDKPRTHAIKYPCCDSFFQMKLNGKYGIINNKGQKITPCKYDAISERVQNTFKVKCNGKFGLIDINGNEIISCDYLNITMHKNNICIVQSVNKRLGLLNMTTGDEILQCVHDRIDYLGNDLFANYFIGIVEIVNTTGKAIWYKINSEISRFKDTFAQVECSEGGGAGLISITGDLVIPFGKYDKLRYLGEGYVKAGVWQEKKEKKRSKREVKKMKELVEKHGLQGLWTSKMELKWGVIDTIGKEILPCEYASINWVHKGWICVEDKERKLIIHGKGGTEKKEGLVNPSKGIKIPCIYDDIILSTNFENNHFAYLKLNGKEIIIDTLGNPVAEIKMDIYVTPDQHISIVAKKNKKGKTKIGLFDEKNNKKITPYLYHQIISLSSHLKKEEQLNDTSHLNQILIVKINEKFGVIDITGKQIIPIKYSHIKLVTENLLALTKQNKLIGYASICGNLYFED